MTTTYDLMDSPIGPLLFVSHGQGIAGIYMERHQRGPVETAGWERDERPFTDAQAQLAAYFAGDTTSFDLDLRPMGTAFQREVWAALRTVPFGQTVSYATLAAMAGMPGKARAVGGANARNPLSIVVPCHRVVGANGTLTGYAGGLERKSFLLQHEANVLARGLEAQLVV